MVFHTFEAQRLNRKVDQLYDLGLRLSFAPPDATFSTQWLKKARGSGVLRQSQFHSEVQRFQRHISTFVAPRAQARRPPSILPWD